MRESHDLNEKLQVSFMLPTHNRREVVLQTLLQIERCGLPRAHYEVLVVDNASCDGTAEAVRDRFPSVHLLRQSHNRGPCAKNAALEMARGKYVVFLDDDSHPQPGSIGRMIGHFEGHPKLGAAVFTITLPDGSQECSAYPNVCIGCGTGFRREALRQVGGLPDDFFMAAEEYDLSLRLLDAGWQVEPFDDLHVMHRKTPMSRFPSRIARLDARNNTLLAMRYFPDSWRMAYVREWLDRYRLLARTNQMSRAFWMGALEGIALGVRSEYRPISAAAFEQFARIEQTESALSIAIREHGLRRVLFCDLGKNILAYRLAARRCGLEVVGIADARLGGRGLRFRGLPIFTDEEAAKLRFDAVVVSNLSPVHARLRTKFWQHAQSRPVLDWSDKPINVCPPTSRIICVGLSA
jgi:GT2 family glycosyltransferase